MSERYYMNEPFIDNDFTSSPVLNCCSRIKKALDYAVRYGGIDGDHHKAWVIDQMVRALTGCPMIEGHSIDCNGNPYIYQYQGESPEYIKLVADAKTGEDGPETYEWNEGIAP